MIGEGCAQKSEWLNMINYIKSVITINLREYIIRRYIGGEEIVMLMILNNCIQVNQSVNESIYLYKEITGIIGIY